MPTMAFRRGKRPRSAGSPPHPRRRLILIACVLAIASSDPQWSLIAASSAAASASGSGSGSGGASQRQYRGLPTLARPAARAISAVTHDEIGGLGSSSSPSPSEDDINLRRRVPSRSRRGRKDGGRLSSLAARFAKLERDVGASLTSAGVVVPFGSSTPAESESAWRREAGGEEDVLSRKNKRGSVGVEFRLRFRGGDAAAAATRAQKAPGAAAAAAAAAVDGTANSTASSSTAAAAAAAASASLSNLSDRLTPDLDNFADKFVGRAFSLLLGSAVAAQAIASLFDGEDAIESVSRRFLSEETAGAVRTIRRILERFSDHGVVDVLGAGHPPQTVVSSMIALGRLQRATAYWEKIREEEGGSRGKLVGGNGDVPGSAESASASEKVGCDASDDDTGGIDPQLLSDLARYVPYANAAYGWKGGLTLFGRLHWGDERALVSRTGVRPDDLVSANWRARTHRPAYFLARDVERRRLVLSIRGTFSPRDVLTDLCCEAEDFWTYDDGDAGADGNSDDSDEADADAADGRRGEKTAPAVAGEYLTDALRSRHRARAHQGMLDGARGVARMTRRIIASELAARPEYDLVLVGHSLGGGTAAVLGSMWRETFPGLRAYAYGAPCVGPAGVAPSEDYEHVVSVVGEGDPFSVLSLGHLADISSAVSKLCEEEDLRGEVLRRTKGDVRTMTREDLEWCAEAMEALRGDMTGEKFYPPGRILYLRGAVNGNSNGGSSNGGALILREVQADKFRELRLHPRMLDLTRHVPSRYESALQKLWIDMEASQEGGEKQEAVREEALA